MIREMGTARTKTKTRITTITTPSTKPRAETSNLEPQDGSAAGRSQSVGYCAVDEERAAAVNLYTTNDAHRNVSDPLPLPPPTTTHIPQFPQQQQQQHDLEPPHPQSPAKHETSQQTPLESHRQTLVEAPPQSPTEESSRDLSINLSLSHSYDKSAVQEFDKDEGTNKEMDREMDKEIRSGICSKEMVQEYWDKTNRILDEARQEPQPTWLQELQTRLFTSPPKRPSPSPSKSSWSSLPPLCFEDTPSGLFYPHQKIQPSAQVWACSLFDGCNRLSKQALRPGHQSMLCRLPDPDVAWESYLETQRNNFWELSCILTNADLLKSLERTLGGIVCHSVVDVFTENGGGRLLAGDLPCALAIIKDQMSTAATTFGFYDQSEYTARIVSVTRTIVQVFDVRYNLIESQITCDLLRTCNLILDLPISNPLVKLSREDKLARLDKEWRELVELVLDVK